MTDLTDSALTTLSAAKSELQIPAGNTGDDDYLKRQINMASQAFSDATGTKWFYAEAHTESVPAYGGRRLEVSDHLPIDDVDEIRLIRAFEDLEDTPLDVDAFAIEDADRGWIRRTIGTFRNTAQHVRDINANPRSGTEELTYEVDYSGGYITPKQADDGLGDRTLPWDVEQAVISLVVSRFRGRSRDPSVVRESNLSGSVTYADTDEGLLPGVYQDAVRRYTESGVA